MWVTRMSSVVEISQEAGRMLIALFNSIRALRPLCLDSSPSTGCFGGPRGPEHPGLLLWGESAPALPTTGSRCHQGLEH